MNLQQRVRHRIRGRAGARADLYVALPGEYRDAAGNMFRSPTPRGRRSR